MAVGPSPLTKAYFLSQWWWEESDEALKWRAPQTHKQAVNEQPLQGAQCFCSIGWLFGRVGGWVGWWTLCRDMEDVRVLMSSHLFSALLPKAPGQQRLFSCCLAAVVWQSALPCTYCLCLSGCFSHMQTFLFKGSVCVWACRLYAALQLRLQKAALRKLFCAVSCNSCPFNEVSSSPRLCG